MGDFGPSSDDISNRNKVIDFLTQRQASKGDPKDDDKEKSDEEDEEKETSGFGERPEDRIVYVADTKNHCIRKVVLQQRNVETVAGVCGRPGFVDGVFTTNKLFRPEVVGVDAQGYLFIYDAGNEVVRMVDLDGNMHTLIDGACRSDHTMPNPAIPFDLEVRGMVCYKRWSKSVPLQNGNDDPYEGEQVEEEEVEEESEGQGEGEGEDEEESDEGPEVDYRLTCKEVHPILCEDR